MNDTTLAALLARAETPCTNDCHNGTIDNSAAYNAWRSEHAEELQAFSEERRRNHSARVGAAERALLDTEPRPFLICACEGVGYVLTDDGRALIRFMERHLPGGAR